MNITIDQVWIAIFGVLAITLVNSRSAKTRMFGAICGFISQPAWFYTTIKKGQIGIMILSIWYTIQWIRGIRNAYLEWKS